MAWPLRDLMRGSLGPIDRPTVAFLGLLSLGWAGTIAAVALPQLWLERGHMQHGFAVFAATQIVPFMYTAENTFKVSYLGELDPAQSEACRARAEGYRHHAPLGTILMASRRDQFSLCSEEALVELESTLRGHRAHSTWRVQRSERGFTLWRE